MAPRLSILMFAALALGCERGTLAVAMMDAGAEAGPPQGHDGAPPSPEPDAPPAMTVPEPPRADAGAPAVDAVGAPDVPGPPDVPPDVPIAPPPPEDPPVLRARQARQQELDTFHQRIVDCYGPLPPSIGLAEDAAVELDSYLPSLRLGLLKVNEAAVSLCLHNLATASCETIADLFAHAGVFQPGLGCDLPLVGTVAEGRPCLTAADCMMAGFTCAPNGATCGSVCLQDRRPAPLPLDGPCETRGGGDCAPGLLCRQEITAMIERQACLPPAKVGEYCDDSLDCALGLSCIPRGPDAFAGSCQPRHGGPPCAQPWQCPELLACVGLVPDHQPGTCQKGKAAGEACTVYPVVVEAMTYYYSDCAYDLSCQDVDGGGLRCTKYSRVGEPCGAVKTPADDLQVCEEGYCDAAEGARGTCRAYVPAGGACQSDEQCQPPAGCRDRPGGAVCGDNVSAPPLRRLGERCGGEEGACEDRAYCEPPPGTNPGTNALWIGVCRLRKRAGDACRPELDSCAPLDRCVGGFCRPC